jgi:hypothetical protein
MTPPEETAPGLLPTYRESPVSWLLLGFIGLSIVVHGFAFLVFQVVYPQRVTIPPPRMQVALLTPTSPENEAILRWVAAEDPALSTAGSVATPPRLYEVPFKPSFATLRTPPRTMPVTAEPPVAPPSPITLPLLTPPGETAAPPAESAPAPSTATFSSPLAQRPFTPAGPLTARATTPLQPALFLIAVSETGEIRQLFRQRSSGDPAADDAAADFLTGGRFAAAPERPLTWATATVTFGRDLYVTAPAPEESRP